MVYIVMILIYILKRSYISSFDSFVHHGELCTQIVLVSTLPAFWTRPRTGSGPSQRSHPSALFPGIDLGRVRVPPPPAADNVFVVKLPTTQTNQRSAAHPLSKIPDIIINLTTFTRPQTRSHTSWRGSIHS